MLNFKQMANYDMFPAVTRVQDDLVRARCNSLQLTPQHYKDHIETQDGLKPYQLTRRQPRIPACEFAFDGVLVSGSVAASFFSLPAES